jgi:hypothetical protein
MKDAKKTRTTRYGELIASFPQSTPDQSPPAYQGSVLASTLFRRLIQPGCEPPAKFSDLNYLEIKLPCEIPGRTSENRSAYRMRPLFCVGYVFIRSSTTVHLQSIEAATGLHQ